MSQGSPNPRMVHLWCKIEYRRPPYPGVPYNKYRPDYNYNVSCNSEPSRKDEGLRALKMKHEEWFHWVGNESLSRPSSHASILYFPNCIAQGHCLQVIPQETHLPGNKHTAAIFSFLGSCCGIKNVCVFILRRFLCIISVVHAYYKKILRIICNCTIQR